MADDAGETAVRNRKRNGNNNAKNSAALNGEHVKELLDKSDLKAKLGRRSKVNAE